MPGVLERIPDNIHIDLQSFEGAPRVSLHTIVQGSLAGRFHLRRDIAAGVPQRTAAVPIRYSLSSMRVLETGLALSAIATALLIGLGR
jgi:hypothetical protein